MLLYFAGTMILYEPSEECIVDFWNDGILKKLPVSSQNPVFMTAASQLRESCTDESSTTKAMSRDFLRLFTRDIMPLAPPYESLYKMTRPEAEMSADRNVIDFYNTYGWKEDFRPLDEDDHLGVELLFLTIMVDKYMSLDDEACRLEMKNEIRRFIDLHILSWVPQWHKLVQENSNTLSYKGVSSIIYASVTDIYSILSGFRERVSEPDHFRN